MCIKPSMCNQMVGLQLLGNWVQHHGFVLILKLLKPIR